MLGGSLYETQFEEVIKTLRHIRDAELKKLAAVETIGEKTAASIKEQALS